MLTLGLTKERGFPLFFLAVAELKENCSLVEGKPSPWPGKEAHSSERADGQTTES